MEFRLTESVVTKSEESYLATLMNTSQVGTKLGMSVKQVKRLVDQGKMAGVKISGRLYIRRSDYEAYHQKLKADLEARAKLIGISV
jgi:DNA-binding transcriptional regulator LsrR (DeoR family)